MEWSEFIADLQYFWFHLVAALDLVVALIASAHVVMYKRDPRAAIAWVGMIWLVPLLGTLLYVLLGINRVRRRAVTLRGVDPETSSPETPFSCSPIAVREALAPHAHHMAALSNLVHELTSRPLLGGNRVAPLDGGDEAYPAMLKAIDEAQHSVALSTYIFNHDRAGKQFVDALQRAVGRGLQVRVIIDDIGARYKWPSIERALIAAKVPVAKFLPTMMRGWFAYANLRNHRKLLIVDGRLGFTGGLNIREGHWAALHPAHVIRDLHFEVEGPVVAHLQEVFADDWQFSKGEELAGPAWFPPLERAGTVMARGISAGPDSNRDKLRMTLLGAIACAESSIAVVTPYFLPDAPLIAALNVAALRGVEVNIILPEQNNLALVKWASTALLWQLLERGCRLWLSPPPFDHAKLMLVDGAWTLLGSGNWDPRSLRLNFEFDVECYDLALAERLEKWVEDKRACARRITLADVDGRPIPIRLRDGVARLLTPYL